MSCGPCGRDFCIQCLHLRQGPEWTGEPMSVTDATLLEKGVFKELYQKHFKTMQCTPTLRALSRVEVTRVAMFYLSMHQQSAQEMQVTVCILKDPRCDMGALCHGAKKKWLKTQLAFHGSWFNRCRLKEEQQVHSKSIVELFNPQHCLELRIQHSCRVACLYVLHSFRPLYGRDIAVLIAKKVYQSKDWFHIWGKAIRQ